MGYVIFLLGMVCSGYFLLGPNNRLTTTHAVLLVLGFAIVPIIYAPPAQEAIATLIAAFSGLVIG
jgi:hypothetical protein